jgi:hypothetical protein
LRLMAISLSFSIVTYSIVGTYPLDRKGVP